jgi:Lon protease-like protein
MKANKFIGMVQPKITKNFDDNKLPSLHKIGCLGKISSFKESDDGRYLIELKGIIRFEILKEVDSNKKYRKFEINCKNYLHDLDDKKENLKFSDLELIFRDLKTLFERRGFIINWKALEKQSLDETINALAMTSPFSLEEKQVLLEAKNLNIRKTKIAEILNTYTYDQFENTTLQ